jgi:hypothetical protein
MNKAFAAVKNYITPSGLQRLKTSAIARFENESERLFLRVHPEVAQLFRSVLATVQRQLERIRGCPCKQIARGDARPRARNVATERTHASRLRGVRARWLALYRARLLFVPEPSPTPHRVPVAPGPEPTFQSHHAVRVAPPARRARVHPALHGHRTERPALRARAAVGRPAARGLSLWGGERDETLKPTPPIAPACAESGAGPARGSARARRSAASGRAGTGRASRACSCA